MCDRGAAPTGVRYASTHSKSDHSGWRITWWKRFADQGQSSSTSDYAFAIRPDSEAPLIGITAPIQGSTLTLGDTISVDWSAQDESSVASVDPSEMSTTNPGRFAHSLPSP